MRRTSPDAAREAVSDTFLIAWRRLPDVPEAPLPWLLVVAPNVLADQRRGGRRYDALGAAGPDLSDGVVHAVRNGLHHGGRAVRLHTTGVHRRARLPRRLHPMQAASAGR